MIALVVAVGAAIAIGLSLLRLFAGPTLYDRTLAANTIVLTAALVCAAGAWAARRSDAIDAALALMFAALVINVALLKVFRARSFQAPLAQVREGL